MTTWEFLKKHWIMSLIGLVICLTAIVSITWAVITREGDEGFLRTEGGLELKWRKGALPLSCTHDAVGADWLALYDQARNEINGKTGLELIGPCIAWRLTDKAMPAHIDGGLTLRAEKLADKDHGGSTVLRWHKGDGHVLSAAVKLNTDSVKKVRYRIVIHELGHVFGLTHDRLQDSIMYPAVNVRPGTLSTTDVKHLKSAYGDAR